LEAQGFLEVETPILSGQVGIVMKVFFIQIQIKSGFVRVCGIGKI
jgi:lysyl-tRNA synthetase class II